MTFSASFHKNRVVTVGMISPAVWSEHHLRTDDLIYPVFILDGNNPRRKWRRCPGLSGKVLICSCSRPKNVCVWEFPHWQIFPVIDASLKKSDCHEAITPMVWCLAL
ncbi:MAG: hypothetical protein P0107_01565 [Nitrosomonas sp.]|nr:hypothetical protein [Nitrosomonas sp.]